PCCRATSTSSCRTGPGPARAARRRRTAARRPSRTGRTASSARPRKTRCRSRPAERGERPQRGREPGIEDIGILPPARRWLLIRTDARDVVLIAVKDRDPVAPPQLPGDAPVVHVVDPAEVPRGEFRRVDPDAAVADRVAGGLGERGDADEPLERL